MADETNDPQNQLQHVPAGVGGLLRWLIAPEKPRVLLPASGLLILVFDWLLFSSTVATGTLWLPASVVLGFLIGSIGTYFLQRRFAHDARWKSLLKSLIAGICVGAPLPLGGTAIGAWVLFFSGLKRK